MSKEKRIEEMAYDICVSRKANYADGCRVCSHHENGCLYQDIACSLYTAGYRKQSEGEWIEHIEKLDWCEDDVEVYYECSCCGANDGGKAPYCANCGAKMKGGVE